MAQEPQKLRPSEEKAQEQGPISERAPGADLALEAETEAMEGRISEVAPSKMAEDQKAKKARKGEDRKVPSKQTLPIDQMSLRERLLANAPEEPKMREEVVKVLTKEKVRLESQIGRFRRKKNYHLLSLAILQLRAVVKELEIVARATYDALKEIWLRVVHKFA